MTPPVIPRRALPLLLLLAAPARAEAFTLEILLRALAAQPARRLRFTEETLHPALEGAQHSEGTLAWTPPDRLERRTTHPFEERLTVSGDRVTYERPDRNLRRELSLDETPDLRPLLDGLRATLAGDLATLLRHFAPTLTGSEEAWTLRLAPRQRLAVQQITLAGSGPHPRTITTTGPTTTTTRLHPEP